MLSDIVVELAGQTAAFLPENRLDPMLGLPGLIEPASHGLGSRLSQPLLQGGEDLSRRMT